MNPTINHKSQKAHLPLLYTVFCLTFAFIHFFFLITFIEGRSLVILPCATGVTSATDQSDPSVGDAAVRKVRERARDFVRDEMRSTWGGSSVGHARER